MATSPLASSPQANFRSTVSESMEDPVTTELMTRAVTVFPCGHIFNEDTVTQCLAKNKPCPLDRQPIEKYVPNYTIRHLAETAGSAPPEEEGPSKEAQDHFERGKELSEQGHHEAAIQELLQALQFSPTYEKAQAYLDFCLQRTSQPGLVASPPPPQLISLSSSEKGKPKEQLEKASSSQGSKDAYTDLLLNLLEEPQIQRHQNLKTILRHQNLKMILEKEVEELMSQETEELTPKQRESYKWTQKLFVDNKVRQFVVDKLQQIHAGSSAPSNPYQVVSTSLAQSSSSASLQPPAAIASSIIQPSLIMPSMPSPSYHPSVTSNINNNPTPSYYMPNPVPTFSNTSISSPASPILPSMTNQPANTTPLNFNLSPPTLSQPSISIQPTVNASPSLPSIAFGAVQWKQYLGDVGIEPALPSNIYSILQSHCPFWPDKKVQETHFLVLVPQTVNGKPLTLESLGKLVKAPKQGNKTRYRYFDIGEYTDPSAPASHWVLMTRDVLPGSRNKSYTDQQSLVGSYAQKTKAPYQVPNILDATVCIFLEYIRSGTRLYNDNPYTYTRCQEKWSADWQLGVGGFAAGGLDVVDDHDGICIGVGALRKF